MVNNNVKKLVYKLVLMFGNFYNFFLHKFASLSNILQNTKDIMQNFRIYTCLLPSQFLGLFLSQ